MLERALPYLPASVPRLLTLLKMNVNVFLAAVAFTEAVLVLVLGLCLIGLGDKATKSEEKPPVQKEAAEDN